MSFLGDIENALITKLSEITFESDPLFATVRGASGGYRPTIRDALRRETTPAAYVAFVEEQTAPEIAATKRGPRFSILVATRSLRQASDPRHDGEEAIGAFTVMERVREELTDFEPVDGRTAVALHDKFVEGDDRTAIYELMYQIRFAAEEAPAAPSDLESAFGYAPEDVNLHWQAPESSPTNGSPRLYKIYRKLEGEDEFTLMDATVAEDLSMTLVGQPLDTNMWYYVTAQNTGGEGEPSGTTFIKL